MAIESGCDSRRQEHLGPLNSATPTDRQVAFAEIFGDTVGDIGEADQSAVPSLRARARLAGVLGDERPARWRDRLISVVAGTRQRTKNLKGLKVAFQPQISTFTRADKGIKRDFQSPSVFKPGAIFSERQIPGGQ
jgi:hypothetical protein